MFLRQSARHAAMLRMGAVSYGAAVMSEVSSLYAPTVLRAATAAASHITDWSHNTACTAGCWQQRSAATSATALQASEVEGSRDLTVADRSDALELDIFRYLNTSLPNLEGQVVTGTVVQSDKRTVLIDVGYKSMQRFFRSELDGVPIYNVDGGNRGIPTELMVGDILHFKIKELETVFGDMTLDVHTNTPDERRASVLQELREALATETPVMGRVLNPVSRGFAIGFGGLVAFCPMSQILVRTAKRVGVLQPFIITTMGEITTARGGLQPNIVAMDASKRNQDDMGRMRAQQMRLEGIRAARATENKASQNLGGAPAASAYALLKKARAARAAKSEEGLRSRVGADE